MFRLKSTPVPRWYELGFSAEGTSITFRIDEGAWNFCGELMSESIVTTATNKSIPSFIGPGVLPWGFGPVFSGVSVDRTGYIRFDFEFPEFFRLKSSKCSEEERVKRTHGPSRTLELLSTLLSVAEHRYVSTCLQAQLLTFGVSMSDEYRLGGWGIWGTVSPVLRAWIARQSEELVRKITMAMRSAYKTMDGSTRWLKETRAVLREDGVMGFHTFGNACDLYPEPSYYSDFDGYTLSPHNVDSPIQQITLFAGLAALYQEAKIDLEGER